MQGSTSIKASTQRPPVENKDKAFFPSAGIFRGQVHGGRYSVKLCSTELGCFLGTSGLFHSLSIKPFKIPVRELYSSANYKRRQRRVRTTGWWERLAGVPQNVDTTSANGGKLASFPFSAQFLHSVSLSS